jgi:hypothetical protein
MSEIIRINNEIKRSNRKSGKNEKQDKQQENERQWELMRARLCEQRDRMMAVTSLEEAYRAILDARLEYGTGEGERPLSETAYFKREALIDKALDQYAKLVSARDRVEEAPEGQAAFDKEWNVVLGMLQDLPEFRQIFEERLNAKV